MQASTPHGYSLSTSQQLASTEVLAAKLQQLSLSDTRSLMKLSDALAQKTYATHQRLDIHDAENSGAAATTFQGDIYSQLRAKDWSDEDYDYANQHLRIISGLYGALRPLDKIKPYRLELGCQLQVSTSKNLYDYWGSSIADMLPKQTPIINLLSEEYFRVIRPYKSDSDIITPQFMTSRSATNQPRFVAIHAKQARGAFARWLITERMTTPSGMQKFRDMDYIYDEQSSTPHQPVFIKQQN